MTVICWRCGASVSGEACPVCGCIQSTRRQPATEVGFALRYAYDKFGPQRVLTDHDTLRRCLSDLIPDERKLRQRLTAVLNTDLSDHLYDILRQGQRLDAGMCQVMVQGLQSACGLTAGQAGEALGYLLEMIGLENPAGYGPQADIPVPPPPDPVPSQPNYAPPRPSNVQSTPSYTPPQPAYVPPQPSYTQPMQDAVLAELQKVTVEDATHGLAGRVALNKPDKLVVWRSGVSFYHYTNRKMDAAPDPWLHIPGGEIFKVSEHFFMGSYEFTIVLNSGVRYRVSPAAKKAQVVEAIAAMRSIING